MLLRCERGSDRPQARVLLRTAHDARQCQAGALSGCACPRRRGFERLLRKLLRLRSAPALLVLHWWAPLHFRGSWWNVAEDELDTLASYYRLQVRRAHAPV